jgi:SAM-dependent methyltransferase
MLTEDRRVRFVQSFLKAYGPTKIKRYFWDKEYLGNKWDFADNTVGDCVYSHLNSYALNGEVLDLGCGSGNTATEMAATYHSYVGVDIAQAALAKAARRSKDRTRIALNAPIFSTIARQANSM